MQSSKKTLVWLLVATVAPATAFTNPGWTTTTTTTSTMNPPRRGAQPTALEMIPIQEVVVPAVLIAGAVAATVMGAQKPTLDFSSTSSTAEATPAPAPPVTKATTPAPAPVMAKVTTPAPVLVKEQAPPAPAPAAAPKPVAAAAVAVAKQPVPAPVTDVAKKETPANMAQQVGKTIESIRETEKIVKAKKDKKAAAAAAAAVPVTLKDDVAGTSIPKKNAVESTLRVPGTRRRKALRVMKKVVAPWRKWSTIK